MKKLEFENQVVRIHSDEEHSYAVLEWLMPLVHTEFVDTMHRLFKIMEDKKLKNLIGDLRLQGALGEDSLAYLNHVLVPVLEQLHKSAIVVPEDAFDKMVTEDMIEQVNMENIQKKHRSFTTVEEAEAWIKQPPTH